MTVSKAGTASSASRSRPIWPTTPRGASPRPASSGSAVNRPNVFIKIPATREGLPAIRQLIAEGINVNITLLFGLPRYRQVAEAYLAGLEDRLNRGEPIDHVASVASFFLSRIDVLIDPILEKKMAAGGPEGKKAGEVLGEVAIASAKVAYYHLRGYFRRAALHEPPPPGGRGSASPLGQHGDQEPGL